MTPSPTILFGLRETVEKFPDQPAVSDASGTITYRELWDRANGVVAWLRGQGATDGMRIIVEARSVVSFAVTVVGTYLSREVLVPVEKNASGQVVSRIAEETGSKLYISGQMLETLSEGDCSATAAGELPVADDVADILFRTGTTGASKGVVISHRAAWAAADHNRIFDRITESTVYLIASPLNHISALRKLEACFLAGAHAVLFDGFVDVKRYYEMVERYRVNALLLPPSAAALLLLVSRDRLHALSDRIKVVHSNGAPMSETTKDFLRRCLPHARLVFAYGTTEAGSACCAYDYAELPGKANCVGKVGPHARITVEDGVMVVSGDTVMEGYLNDPVRTAEVLRDGRFHTHDLGRVGDDGFVYVHGRKDDVINVGGMKVVPGVIEEVAMRYPEIVDCACFGTDDSLTGSAVKLNVVPRDASGFDLVAFRRFLQEYLERHELPSRIACVTAIPRTRNGKTDRSHLA